MNLQSFQSESQPIHIQEKVQNKQICCQNGKFSTLLCSNKNCQQYAFVCQNQNCKCKLSHKLCIQSKTNTIVQLILSKSFTLNPLSARVQEMFQKSIDELSEMREKIMGQFNQKCQLLGLNQNQLKFIKAIKSSQVKQITCDLIWNVLHKVHDNQKSIKNKVQINKDIQILWTNFDKEVKKFDSYFQKYLQNIQKPLNNWLQSSTIAQTFQYRDKLVNFFTRDIRQIELLYRASQNNFQAEAFHKACDGVGNTLTLCLTEFDKVIGGFTGLKWNEIKQNYAYGLKADSFMFSLTLNEKYSSSSGNNVYQIYNNQSYGPTFGGGHDLMIANKANQNTTSYANIGFSYTRQGCMNGNAQYQKRFSGARNFRVKEWEVWKVYFIDE